MINTPNRIGALLHGTVISLVGLVATLAPTTGFAKATLQVVRGSGEFQTIQTAITLTKPESLTMQWSTDQSGLTGGTWQITSAAARNKLVVASGEAPAPPAGKFIRFTIPSNAFLQSSPPAALLKFHITIVPHNAAKQPLGSASPAVVVFSALSSPVAWLNGFDHSPSSTLRSLNQCMFERDRPSAESLFFFRRALLLFRPWFGNQ